MQNEDKNKKRFKALLTNSFRITKLLTQEKKGLVLTTFILILSVSVLPFVRSFISGQLINLLIESAKIQTLSVEVLWFLGALISTEVMQGAARSFQSYQSIILWHYIEEKFDLLVLRKKAVVDIASYEDPKLHSLIQKINDGGSWRLNNMAERQFYLLENLIELTVATTILGSRAWWIAPLVLLGSLPELLVEKKYGEQKWSITNLESEERKQYWHLQDHFRHLPWLIEVKLLSLTKNFIGKISELYQNFKQRAKQNEKKRLFANLIAGLASQVTLATSTVYFILEVVKGSLDIGTLTFLLASIASLRAAISSSFRNIARQYEDNLFVSDLFEFLDLPPKLTVLKNPVVLKSKTAPKIVFDNVSFKYPGKEQWILKNISFEIQTGEKLAIVGVNGAGKTTLVKLLCRFYDPTEGNIYIDDRDLKTIEINSWYKQMGVLFQDYGIYHFTPKKAVALGNIENKVKQEKIRESGQHGEALKFIEEYPDKWDQQLGREYPKGIEPSDGQWQKLALSRVFYRNANIWVLDEPTASVDAESESRIFERLEKLPKDKSVILISHRFSTVRQADKIIVLKDGKIYEQGSHAKLIQNNKDYARLFKMQAKGYE